MSTTVAQQQQKQQEQEEQNQKHPLRIVNEYYDIDSLNALKQDYDRMETAEAAAQKSGETLRKWVESDQRAESFNGTTRRGSSSARKRTRASIFSASMSNAAFFTTNTGNENDEEEQNLQRLLFVGYAHGLFSKIQSQC